MNSPIFVGESVLYLSKILIYEFYHDYIIPKWCKNCKPSVNCRLIPSIKTDDFYEDIADDFEKWFDTLN